MKQLASKKDQLAYILLWPYKTKHWNKKETINYKVFDKNRFNEDLKSKLDSIDKLDYPLFESLLINVLDIHAPVTTKTASKWSPIFD